RFEVAFLMRAAELAHDAAAALEVLRVALRAPREVRLSEVDREHVRGARDARHVVRTERSRRDTHERTDELLLEDDRRRDERVRDAAVGEREVSALDLPGLAL